MLLANLFTVAASDPIAHVVNHKAFDIDGWWIWSGNMGNLLLSALILCMVGPWVASKVKTGPESLGNDRYLTKGSFAHMVEVICVYLRDTIVRPMLGERTDKFMPFLWTLFFFILVNNLLGLIPLLDIQNLIAPGLEEKHIAYIGGTLTQNLFVTGALALIAFIVINIAGIIELGPVEYCKHLTGGAPVFVWPILIPVEIAGIFIKPMALAIRLFANMTAGHVLVAAMFGFIAFALTEAHNIALGATVTILSGTAAVMIYFLELFVAFLQAFVFMFLTAVFISLLSHSSDHEHEGAHGHEHAHA